MAPGRAPCRPGTYYYKIVYADGAYGAANATEGRASDPGRGRRGAGAGHRAPERLDLPNAGTTPTCASTARTSIRPTRPRPPTHYVGEAAMGAAVRRRRPGRRRRRCSTPRASAPRHSTSTTSRTSTRLPTARAGRSSWTCPSTTDAWQRRAPDQLSRRCRPAYRRAVRPDPHLPQPGQRQHVLPPRGHDQQRRRHGHLSPTTRPTWNSRTACSTRPSISTARRSPPARCWRTSSAATGRPIRGCSTSPPPARWNSPATRAAARWPRRT